MDELYLGLMSGTSMDGIDAVLIDLSGDPRILATKYNSYEKEVRDHLIALCADNQQTVFILPQSGLLEPGARTQKRVPVASLPPPFCAAEAQHRGHFLRRARPQHGQRRAGVLVAEVDAITFARGRAIEHLVGPERALQRREKLRAHRRDSRQARRTLESRPGFARGGP